MFEQPSDEQLAAVNAFADQHGRTWKSVLNNMWTTGRDTTQPNGHLLRQVRNQFGPDWLQRYKR